MHKDKIVFTEHLPKGGFSENGVYIEPDKINWQKSIGMNVKFVYYEIHGELLILGYNPTNKKVIVKYKEHEEYEILAASIRNGNLGEMLKNEKLIVNRVSENRVVDFSNLKKKSYTQVDWDKSIGLEFYFEYDGESGYIEILSYEKINQLITLKYEKTIYTIKTSDILKCKLQSVIGKRYTNHRFKMGDKFLSINGEFEITEPFRKYEESHNGEMKWYKYKCLQCGWDKGEIRENDITRKEKNKGACRKCGDRISFPNKLAYNILTQLNVDFIPEYSPEWIKPRRYDFYFEKDNKKYLLEMDGGFHKTSSNIGTLSLDRIKEIDKEKDLKAIENGFILIRIDSHISSIDFIKCNMINSEFSTLFDLHELNWDECLYNCTKSILLKICDMYKNGNEICDISKKLKFSSTTISKYLKIGSKLGFSDYTPKITVLTNSTAEESKRKVICLNTLEIYESVSEANKKNKCSGISGCCRGKIKSAEKHQTTGEKLTWMYYDKWIEIQDKSTQNIG